MTTMNEIRTAAIQTYAELRDAGAAQEGAAQAAWIVACKLHKRWRAHRWDEAIDHNSCASRSYKSPMGIVLGLGGVEGYGSHCNQYPRTMQSIREYRAIRGAVLMAR